MHRCVAVCKIVGIRLLIHPLLLALHVAQVFDIIRVGESHTIFRVGKVGKNLLPACLCLVGISVAHIHQIHIIIYVKAIHIVGIAGQQLVERGFGGIHILKFVLQDYAHIKQSLLHDVVRVLYFLLRFGICTR